MLKGKWLIHPFLIGIFPILFLYAYNISFIHIKEIIQPTLVVIVCTFLLLIIAKVLFKSWNKAGIITSILLLLFFSYQAIHLRLIYWFGEENIKQSVLIPAFAILIITIAYFLIKSNSSFTRLTKTINFFSILLVLLPISQIVYLHIKRSTLHASEAKYKPLVWKHRPLSEQRPDIVYLILDGYGRADILKKDYKVEMDGFTSFLEDEGFFIATESNSNYSRTPASLASSLNLDYIQNLAGYHPQQSYKELHEAIEHARLPRWLASENYNLFSFTSGVINKSMLDFATLISPFKATPPFVELLVNLTPLKLLEDNALLNSKYSFFKSIFIKYPVQKPGLGHYKETLYILEHLPTYIGQDKPSFVFADVFIAHPPFVFNKNGSYHKPHPVIPNLVFDGNLFTDLHPEGKKAYIEGYRNQVEYLNQKLKEMVLHLKRKMTRPTIIILQGDHGPGANYHQKDYNKTNLKERFGIMNAIYVSNQNKALFPKNLTPVNTFRVLLNHYFNSDLKLLPNRQFYSPINEPTNVVEVTHLVQDQ
ncbi:hypothetical protein TH61_07570 [Rufibacter sp. DG15C]|uniref:hypothetical protein n=1 Tax=Rufibacter sp. DG15C TaxID=1379909 RepID=UPI00078D6751|nr:hypothetical protein [Rufibacter sp. DG15C]AMM51064.1 hypothetical protein TH61_07570 [Rufibacter sp. DG15C]